MPVMLCGWLLPFSAVGPPAEQLGAPAGRAKQIDECVGVERERDAVVAHAVQRGHAAGCKRRAVGLAHWARDVEAIEGNPARREPVDRGRADRPVAVAAEVVGAQLVGDEEQDVGAIGHAYFLLAQQRRSENLSRLRILPESWWQLIQRMTPASWRWRLRWAAAGLGGRGPIRRSAP